MKKFGLLVLGGIAAIVLLANMGPMIGLAISLLVLYYSFKQFVKTDSTFAKVIWAVIGLAALSASAANFPAIIGIAAIYLLYVVIKQWKQEKPEITESGDPFTNFEKEWANLKNN
ncbi:flagellar basal body rod protein [Bacillus salacetis]|uniref:Flagellar basal body rod protein n=1 Tax=Bacillus salacetis TaxID=2315464 RepID=A0A3A1QVA7_9BACI|nr:flagellar basal body rod protein [Bacillus salacetis]RIW32263.1 flagellar basal body rod protein [Bacillus salacetis]